LESSVALKLNTKMRQFRLRILESDFDFFKSLDQLYRSDPSAFVTKYNNNINDEQLDSSISATPTFEEFVTTSCSCGNCYNLFARTDKIPWRRFDNSNIFVNSKHGFITVYNCPVNQYEGLGFLQISKKEHEPMEQLQANMYLHEQEKYNERIQQQIQQVNHQLNQQQNNAQELEPVDAQDVSLSETVSNVSEMSDPFDI
jgi:hypothetical protein